MLSNSVSIPERDLPCIDYKRLYLIYSLYTFKPELLSNLTVDTMIRLEGAQALPLLLVAAMDDKMEFIAHYAAIHQLALNDYFATDFSREIDLIEQKQGSTALVNLLIAAIEFNAPALLAQIIHKLNELEIDISQIRYQTNLVIDIAFKNSNHVSEEIVSQLLAATPNLNTTEYIVDCLAHKDFELAMLLFQYDNQMTDSEKLKYLNVCISHLFEVMANQKILDRNSVAENTSAIHQDLKEYFSLQFTTAIKFMKAMFANFTGQLPPELLLIAMICNDLEWAEQLLTLGVNINAKVYNLMTLFNAICVINVNLEALQFIIANNVDINCVDSIHKGTNQYIDFIPLFYACYSKNYDLLNILLNKNVNLSITNHKQQTIGHIAAIVGDIAIITHLQRALATYFKKNAKQLKDFLNSKDINGYTLLDVAHAMHPTNRRLLNKLRDMGALTSSQRNKQQSKKIVYEEDIGYDNLLSLIAAGTKQASTSYHYQVNTLGEVEAKKLREQAMNSEMESVEVIAPTGMSTKPVVDSWANGAIHSDHNGIFDIIRHAKKLGEKTVVVAKGMINKQAIKDKHKGRDTSEILRELYQKGTKEAKDRHSQGGKTIAHKLADVELIDKKTDKLLYQQNDVPLKYSIKTADAARMLGYKIKSDNGGLPLHVFTIYDRKHKKLDNDGSKLPGISKFYF
jgi:ankyrin repeat protein